MSELLDRLNLVSTSDAEIARLRAQAAQAAADAAQAKADAAQAALEAALALQQSSNQIPSDLTFPDVPGQASDGETSPSGNTVSPPSSQITEAPQLTNVGHASATQSELSAMHETAESHDAKRGTQESPSDTEQTRNSSSSPSPISSYAEEVRAGYAFDSPALTIGTFLDNGNPIPGINAGIPFTTFNRHGLITGATGTGKTRTLQLLAEGLSSHGIPVFLTDIKGDLTGLLEPGQSSEKLMARTSALGQDWQGSSFPVELFSLGGAGKGVPIRTTVTDFGPILLSKVLGLNDTQESALSLIFSWADNEGLALVDLTDLRATIQYLTSPEGKDELKNIGGVSPATAGVILREISALQAQGADAFFGEPSFETSDFLRQTSTGQGVISTLELPDVASQPALFSTFIMWLLASLFHDLPEVGDVEKPKLVFFFDEAHLLFNGASDEFLNQVVQTVRLIRSKGVGIFFVTQTPKDVPGDVLAQLGARIQHALRAHTPNDLKSLKATVNTFPHSPLDLLQLLPALGTGEAIVTVLGAKGRPTPVAPVRLWAPSAVMGPSSNELVDRVLTSSTLMERYKHPVDPESAFELLRARIEAETKAAEEAKAAEIAAKEEKKAAERAARQAEREAAADEKRRLKELEAQAKAAAKAEEREMREYHKALEHERRKQERYEERQAKRREAAIDSVVRSIGRNIGSSITRSLFGSRKR